MAIPVTNIPVLTGEVAERFIEQCEYNAKHLAGSEWSQEKEDWFNGIMESILRVQSGVKRKKTGSMESWNVPLNFNAKCRRNDTRRSFVFPTRHN